MDRIRFPEGSLLVFFDLGTTADVALFVPLVGVVVVFPAPVGLAVGANTSASPPSSSGVDVREKRVPGTHYR